MENNEKATWEINCDGYYPYCSRCYFEPDRIDVIDNGLPSICPNCGCIMTNADEMNAHRVKKGSNHGIKYKYQIIYADKTSTKGEAFQSELPKLLTEDADKKIMSCIINMV